MSPARFLRVSKFNSYTASRTMTCGGFLLRMRAMSSGLTWVTAELFVVAIDDEVLPI